MTAAARISQADIDRAMKGLKTGGFERARVIFDFANSRIEVIIGEEGSGAPVAPTNPWDSLIEK